MIGGTIKGASSNASIVERPGKHPRTSATEPAVPTSTLAIVVSTAISTENNVEAIQSGLVFGTAGEVDGIVDRIRRQLGGATTIGSGLGATSTGGRAFGAGVGIVALYLAGAAVSGRASILTRRPLLDGLAPPTPYRWVSPPPDLAASNKPPASTRFTVELTAEGSQLGAFSTSDGQVNLVLSQGAVPPRSGQH